MKKFLRSMGLFAVVILFAVSVVACGKKGGDDTTPPADTNPPAGDKADGTTTPATFTWGTHIAITTTYFDDDDIDRREIWFSGLNYCVKDYAHDDTFPWVYAKNGKGYYYVDGSWQKGSWSPETTVDAILEDEFNYMKIADGKYDGDTLSAGTTATYKIGNTTYNATKYTTSGFYEKLQEDYTKEILVINGCVVWCKEVYGKDADNMTEYTWYVTANDNAACPYWAELDAAVAGL